MKAAYLFLIRYLKILWLAFWVTSATLVLAMPAVLLTRNPRTRKWGEKTCSLWAHILLGVTGVRTRASGLDFIVPGQSYIIAANHQSHFDVLALLVALPLPLRWVIKKELRKIPVFGFAVEAMQNIIIDRSDPRSAVRSIQEGVTKLPPGSGLLFFVEGTRSADGRIGPYKKGGFRTAQITGFPVLPVVIRGSRDVLPKGDIVFSSGTIEIVVLSPLDVHEHGEEELSTLMEDLRDRMIAVFHGCPDPGKG